MPKADKRKIAGKTHMARKGRPTKRKQRASDNLSVTVKDEAGNEVYSPTRAVLANATVGLSWDCVIDEDGVDPDEWAKGFVKDPNDPAMRQRFLAALTRYLNEQLPKNNMVLDVFTGPEGKTKVKLRLALSGQEMLKRFMGGVGFVARSSRGWRRHTRG